MASVSPDGKWLAFAGQKNMGQLYNQSENAIWLVDDKQTLEPLEAPALPGRAPAWSPDGKRIAFESNRASPSGYYAVFVANRDGSGLVQVTDYALNANHPSWSGDGRRLAFSQGDPDKKVSTIAIADLR
jgi:Tol biopolymer transport system component